MQYDDNVQRIVFRAVLRLNDRRLIIIHDSMYLSMLRLQAEEVVAVRNIHCES